MKMLVAHVLRVLKPRHALANNEWIAAVAIIIVLCLGFLKHPQ